MSHTATTPTPPRSSSLMTWATHAAWVAVALSGAFAVDGAQTSADTVARVIIPVAWWALVGGVLVALVVPAPIGLTAVRLTAPLTVVLAVVCLGAGTDTAWGTAFLAASLWATGIFLSPEFAATMVQGSAYGSEHRFPLRAPATVLLPMVVLWTAWAGCTSAALAMLASPNVVVGAPCALVSLIAGGILAPRFHRLARRWLVLVPAGVVIHDPLVLGETFMAPRPNIVRVSLAAADSEAADLTGPAAGHLVEVVLHELALVVFPASAEHPRGRAIHVQSFLVAPSRPGAALTAFAATRIPVG